MQINVPLSGVLMASFGLLTLPEEIETNQPFPFCREKLGFQLPVVFEMGYNARLSFPMIVPKKKQIRYARCLLGGVLALLWITANAYAGGGVYQRTKDGKALVWNNYPQPGDTATWSGDRDPAGYATGYGTLTWYTGQHTLLTGSNIPTAKYALVGRYSGNMARGKFDGTVVSVDPGGKTSHGTFADGQRTRGWIAGPPPANPQRAQSTAEASNRDDVQEKPTVEPPAEGPSSSPEEQPSSQPIVETATAETPNPAVDDSLRSLISPPSLLRMKRSAAASPPPSAALTSTAQSQPASARLPAKQVVELADAEARAQGYDLAKYLRPQPHYSSDNDTWSVVYDQKKDANGMDGIGRPFSVSVEDKTEKASIVAGR